MKKTGLVITILIMALLDGALTWAGDPGIKLGVLKCHQIQGSRVNLLIHSTAQVTCLFTSFSGERQAIYKGETGIGLGIDLNWNKSETIAFTVFGASADVTVTHPLAGKYIGGRVSASAGVGTGVQMLLGGSGNQFTLQPLAIEKSKGFGVAVGLGYLYLEAAK